jgi:hypothetical protein
MWQDTIEIWENGMSEIVLQISDEVSLDKIVTLLAPYIAKAEVKEPEGLHGKVWTGEADWLKNSFKVDSFTPLTREEAHALRRDTKHHQAIHL